MPQHSKSMVCEPYIWMQFIVGILYCVAFIVDEYTEKIRKKTSTCSIGRISLYVHACHLDQPNIMDISCSFLLII